MIVITATEAKKPAGAAVLGAGPILRIDFVAARFHANTWGRRLRMRCSRSPRRDGTPGSSGGPLVRGVGPILADRRDGFRQHRYGRGDPLWIGDRVRQHGFGVRSATIGINDA